MITLDQQLSIKFQQTVFGSKVMELKLAFERGERLTVLDALRLYHTTELRQYVTQLKNKYGLNIVSKKVKGKTHHIYYLQKEMDS